MSTRLSTAKEVTCGGEWDDGRRGRGQKHYEMRWYSLLKYRNATLTVEATIGDENKHSSVQVLKSLLMCNCVQVNSES